MNQKIIFVPADISLLQGLSLLRPSISRLLVSKINAKMSTSSGPIELAIREAISDQLEPIHYEVINESYMHNVPKGAETHFKVLVVSQKFESLPLIKVRRRQIHICVNL